MKKCPCCQTEYPDDVMFCKTCGKKLIAANVCPECGKEIENDAVFCPYCGHNLKTDSETSHTKGDIEKYRRELDNLKRKKHNMKVGGAICLGVGLAILVLSIVGLVFYSVNFDESASHIAMLVFSVIGVCVGCCIPPFGVILLVVQSAVFTKKISNREQAIREYEEK